ncbi:hypothetical protein [Pseudoduganella umbonata]|nr:hypothetical protein [Pseudoduganella umbonata]
MAGPPSGWPRAFADFSGAARDGDANAAYWAGLMVRNGKGTAADTTAAVAWLEQAARGGVPDAMFVLANMLIAGEGGAPDAAAGHAWLQRAAALGQPAALQQLAQGAYEEGAAERADALLKEAAHALKHRTALP